MNKNQCAVAVDGDASFFNNPQFRVSTTSRSAKVYCSLVPLSIDAVEGAPMNSITITCTPKGPGTPLRVWDIGTCDIIANDTPTEGIGRMRGQEVSIWSLDINNKNYYHIIPHTMRKGQEGSFIVRLYRYVPLSLLSLLSLVSLVSLFSPLLLSYHYVCYCDRHTNTTSASASLCSYPLTTDLYL